MTALQGSAGAAFRIIQLRLSIVAGGEPRTSLQSGRRLGRPAASGGRAEQERLFEQRSFLEVSAQTNQGSFLRPAGTQPTN